MTLNIYASMFQINNEKISKFRDWLAKGHPSGSANLLNAYPWPLPAHQPNLTPAAVLVPIILNQPHESILLTQRTPHLANHGGQISFPGGRLDATDSSLIDCAMRETYEEVGIQQQQINIIAPLGDWPSVSGFLITAYLGVIDTPVCYNICKNEVAEVIEMPLAYMLELSHYEKIHVTKNNHHYHYYQIAFENKIIWGFTASLMYFLAKWVHDLNFEK